MGADEQALVARRLRHQLGRARSGRTSTRSRPNLPPTSGRAHAVAVSSGTAALHLALRLAGVGPGDEVLGFDPSRSARASTRSSTKARRPVFIDAEPTSWNLDPNLVEDASGTAPRGASARARSCRSTSTGRAPTSTRIVASGRAYGVPRRGGRGRGARAPTYHGRAAGHVRPLGHLLVQRQQDHHHVAAAGCSSPPMATLAAHARKLATQARDAAPHYEHTEVGFNYRLCNVLAGIGRGQLRVLDERVAARRAPLRRLPWPASPTCPASASCRRRRGGGTRAGSRASRSTPTPSGLPARTCAWRWRPSRSRRARLEADAPPAGLRRLRRLRYGRLQTRSSATGCACLPAPACIPTTARASSIVYGGAAGRNGA